MDFWNTNHQVLETSQTSGLFSFRKSPACARTSKLTTTNMYIARARLLCSSFSMILNSSVGLWVGIQSAGELVSQTSQLQILHSSEEDNLSPFDSKIVCLCQSTSELTTNMCMYVYVCLYVFSYVRTYVHQPPPPPPHTHTHTHTPHTPPSPHPPPPPPHPNTHAEAIDGSMYLHIVDWKDKIYLLLWYQSFQTSPPSCRTGANRNHLDLEESLF